MALLLLLGLGVLGGCDPTETSAPSPDTTPAAPGQDASDERPPGNGAEWRCPDDDPLFDLVGAALDGKLDRVVRLTEQCIDSHERSTFDEMALRRAAQLGHMEIVEYLLDFGADPAAPDNLGDNALHWAARWIHLTDYPMEPDPVTDAAKAAVVQRLLEAEVDVNSRGEGGRTPLVLAAIGGWARVIELLLDAGADVDVGSDLGEWPLASAAGSGRADVVQLLLDAGADTTVRDSLGRTALDIARAGGHEDVVALLEQ